MADPMLNKDEDKDKSVEEFYKKFKTKEELTSYINEQIANINKKASEKDDEVKKLKSENEELIKMKEEIDKIKLQSKMSEMAKHFKPETVEFVLTKIDDTKPFEEEVKRIHKEFSFTKSSTKASVDIEENDDEETKEDDIFV